MTKNKKTILYKSIPPNKTSHGHKWHKGKWYKITGKLEICENGFHASENIIDAMRYVNCRWIAKVEVRGESVIQSDKQCWSEMRIVEWHKWTKKDSVSLAIFAAELVIDNFEKEFPKDKRPREAIESAKKVLQNDTEENRSAAWSAASAASAAKSAAWSAASAAWSAESAASAAKSAAWSAARSAAESAAWSAARSAAESARQKVLKQCHDFVIDRKFSFLKNNDQD